jgi:CheY-like chemotaxis protein
MRLVLVSSDLAVQSRVSTAAGPLGLTVEVASPEAASDAAAAGGEVLVVLDLGTPGAGAELVTRLRAILGSEAPIVAFGPHVHVEKLQAARAAGCTEVVSRGAFQTQTSAILAPYAQGGGREPTGGRL